MKKIMIFAAVAALLSLSSCTKEGPRNTDNGSPVFTAGINPGTKTTIDTDDGKVAWEETDVITITDAAKQSAEYKITKIDPDGRATFEFNKGDELGAGPYSASYGEQPEEAQTYSATAPGKLYMTASSENNVLTFTVQCALMEINLTKEGESVKKIEVTGTPTGEAKTTYTLTCTEAVSIAETKAFYISLPAGTYTKIVITDSEDKVCTLNVKNQGIPVTVNQIVPATFAADHLDFLSKGALPDVFTVGKGADGIAGTGDDVQVRFSKGNLWYGKVGEATEATFNFEVNQYDTTPASNGGYWSADHISHFFWSKDARVAYLDNYDNANATYGIEPDASDVFFTNDPNDEEKANSDFKVKVGDIEQSGWRTLTKYEWCYLFAYDPENYEFIMTSPRSNLHKTGVTVCGKTNCTVLLPDGWKWEGAVGTDWQDGGYSEETQVKWSTMEAAGAVCLPAAGYRYDYDAYVNNIGNSGHYWSSTANGEDEAYLEDFDMGPDCIEGRYNGFSVRLVTDVK